MKKIPIWLGCYGGVVSVDLRGNVIIKIPFSHARFIDLSEKKRQESLIDDTIQAIGGRKFR